jgi:heme O synthase-like polyprenyltransferase
LARFLCADQAARDDFGDFHRAVRTVGAPGHINPVLGFATILCIAVGAGGAAALNQWWEADIDAGMKRTAKRPLPSGRMERERRATSAWRFRACRCW